MEENKRLKELKLSLYVNHIDKSKDKIQYSIVDSVNEELWNKAHSVKGLKVDNTFMDELKRVLDK